MTEELAGKVAVVTGGASGIGRATVAKLVAEGAKVVMGDLDPERGAEAIAEHGDAARFVPTDVSDPEQIERLVEHALQTFGGLDVMCNNAGIPGKMHPSLLLDDLGDFHRVLGVNLLGVMAGTKFAARHMAEHGGGAIINVSSVGGLQAGGGVQTYRASKAGVIHFTKSAAIELAQYDIRVNCLAPGNIPTALLTTSAAGMPPDKVERFAKAVRASMNNDRPLPREGVPDHVADAVVYLAGDRALYVTGTVLPIDGGTTAGKPLKRKKSGEGESAEQNSGGKPVAAKN